MLNTPASTVCGLLLLFFFILFHPSVFLTSYPTEGSGGIELMLEAGYALYYTPPRPQPI